MKDFFSTKIADKKELEDTVNQISSRIEKKIDEEPIRKNEKLDILTAQFIEYIEDQKKISFGEFFEDIRTQMKREQVMSIAIGVTPPSKDETKRWYINNSDKLGAELHLKHILIRPRDNSLTEQKNTNKKIADLRARIMAGESFEKLAAQFSQDPLSAQKGGDLGWVLLHELDPYFANYANQLYTKGQISNVVSSSFGYHLIKLIDRKPVTYEKVEKLIMFKLYNESMLEQFNKWVNKRKNESDIKIYMPKYIKG
jgi:putative peptidyl-prolyl cis-trans isomerase